MLTALLYARFADDSFPWWAFLLMPLMMLGMGLMMWFMMRMMMGMGSHGASHGAPDAPKAGPAAPSALEILEERYARGEIGSEEFEEVRRRLSRRDAV